MQWKTTLASRDLRKWRPREPRRLPLVRSGTRCHRLGVLAFIRDPEGIITAGHENKTARTVAVRHGETINAPALTAMFKQIIANNRAGGWSKLKRDG
jgi:hypothetical protein